MTGAHGQLGHDLYATLKDHELHGLDVDGLDIADRAQVLRAADRLRPECIINAAAYNDVDGAETDRDRAFAVNAAGPENLAQAAGRVQARLIHVSTDYVFDGQKGSPYTEGDRPNPINVYGWSKYEGEQRVLRVEPNACVLRTAWLYGRHGKNFVKAILAAARAGPLRVVIDQVGSPTASLDLAEAIRELLARPAIKGIFHVVNAGSCSRYAFARAILRDRVQVEPITTGQLPRAAARPANAALVSGRWEAAGLTALQPWEAALNRFLANLAAVDGVPSSA